MEAETIDEIKKVEDVKLEIKNNNEVKSSNIGLEAVKSSIESNKEIDTIAKKTKHNYSHEEFNEKTILVKSIKEIENCEEKVLDINSNIIENISLQNLSNKKKVSVKEEMFKLDSKITYEYNKTIGELDFSKIRGYKVEDGNRTISFLFYENDFYAVNRVNFKDGYMYSEKRDIIPISENLNNIIRKIPNVAKARNILNIKNIEARIYDMTEYILLLEREKIRVIKVSENGELSEMQYSEYPVDRKRLKFTVEKLSIAEKEKNKEENNIKNRLNIFRKSIRKHLVNPIRIALIKMGIINDVKLLTDGKRSVFEKKM